MLRKLLSVLAVQDDRRAQAYREIIRREAAIGGKLFGDVHRNSRREFFCLDEHTWVWHEEWTDQNGIRHAVTTRYDVRPNGVLKAQDNQPYQYISVEEARSLYKAVDMYNHHIDTELYGLAA
ncbi:MAG TPA: hypothetical protein VMY99_02540 [Nevskiaceae bacterium]|nr:hypothetical protein [Nevskiaceae bacterium]